MKNLYRSTSNQMVGGICGGLGDYFNTDATLIRLGIVVVSFLFAQFPAVVLAYIIGMIIIPEDTENSLEENE